MSLDDTPVENNHASQPEHLPETPAQPTNGDQQPSSDDTALAAALKQAQGYLDGWQRERAEFNNYKRRVESQLKDSYQNAAADVLKGFLEVMDDFERALATAPAELAESAWLDGVSAIQRKLIKLLDQYGVSIIDPTGQPFDPSQHEAVAMDDSAEAESGHVTATLQKGYQHGERVLRPALVRVAR